MSKPDVPAEALIQQQHGSDWAARYISEKQGASPLQNVISYRKQSGI